MSKTVIVSYLEMRERNKLRFRECHHTKFEIKECLIKQWQINKCFYQIAGNTWSWRDRLVWTDEQWEHYAEAENLKTFIAYKAGSPAGYYELRRGETEAVEVVYLGLLPKFIGKGYGSFLIRHALRSAWDWGATRVWLHTCTNDHPNALNAYIKSGLKVYKQEEKSA